MYLDINLLFVLIIFHLPYLVCHLYFSFPFQFSIAWWLIIDVAACYPDQESFNHAFHVCGVMGTISMIM